MDMHRDLIKSYIQYMTIGRGSEESEPFADITLFDNDIHSMRTVAENAGDLEWLRLSMDALIANPSGRIGHFVSQGYPFSDDEMLRLFTYAYKQIWPDREISERGEEAQLNFVDMTDEAWEAIKNPPGDDEELF